MAKADGSASLTKEYLDDGRTVRTRYYGTGGEPVTIQSGYAVLEEYYDDANKKIGEGYFDAELNPVYKTKQSFVRYLTEFREDGTQRTEYYGKDGSVVKVDEK